MTPSAATALAHDRSGPRNVATVVLLHAAVADRRMWDPQWERLRAAYDVVRLDLRGFGQSDALPTTPWSAHEDVIDTLASLDIAHAHLVGCSFGAGVAVEVALARPDLVSSLLLASPGGCLIPERTAELREFGAAESSALERGDLDAAADANVTWWVDGPRREPGSVDAGIRTAVRRMQRRAFEVTSAWEESGAEDLETELSPPALPRLAEVASPTLVLQGDLDIDAVVAGAELLAAGIPGATLVRWPDVAHLPSMERPDDFTDLLLDWIRRHPPSRSAGPTRARSG